MICWEYAALYALLCYNATTRRDIFWLAAETAESLMKSLRQIAEVLELPEQHVAEQAQMVAAVKRWLSTHAGWLLIGDNVEDLELLQSVLPPRRSGALLLTTRRQALDPLADPLELPPMSHEEGVAVLLRRARQPSTAEPFYQWAPDRKCLISLSFDKILRLNEK